MSGVGFETTIPAKAFRALDRAAAVIGSRKILSCNILCTFATPQLGIWFLLKRELLLEINPFRILHLMSLFRFWLNSDDE
jgi:hypothetical protein